MAPTPLTWRRSRRCGGPTSTSDAIRIITIASKRNRKGPERKWKPHAAARTIARFAQRTTSATNIAGDLFPWCCEEVDNLVAQGVEYIYFIDEIFLPNKELLEGLAERSLKIGVQTRIDLWSEPLLDLMGRAGCVSIEAGVESHHRGRPRRTR